MPPPIAREKLERLLFDDAPYGDLTTELLGVGAQPGVMNFSARNAMVLALAQEGAAILEMAGARVDVFRADGDALAAGDEILQARGPASALLRGWKVAQTLIEIWSGVATGTREILDAARAVAPGICVACTRKNTPGVKDFSAAAVRAGGAVMHRLGLSETILVFPEHRAFLADETLERTAARLRREAPEKKLVIEARDLDEALAAAKAGFRRDPGGKVWRGRDRAADRPARALEVEAGDRGGGRNQPDQRSRLRPCGRRHSRHLGALCGGAARRIRAIVGQGVNALHGKPMISRNFYQVFE